MAGVDVNYFTCTLEQAVQRRLQAVDAAPSFRTVLELIDEQARLAPSSPAIGFANFTASRAPAPPLTFRQLHDLSVAAARELSSLVEPPDGGRENPTIGLLCASSLDFVLTWLGLMRLGWAILLLAPQLEARAAEHLCRVLDIRVVFTDSEERGGKINDGIRIVNIPSYHRCQASPRTSGRLHVAKRPRVPPIAYFCHTSGTSSGLPKPIAQMHFGVVGALPRFCQRHEPATFSTTPLYHGGLADCLRAWTSGALIWLFPEGLAPVTTANLLEAVRYARSRCAVPIRYFSSVPYVAQRLAEEDAGIKLLRSMDLVGVGGAAVPAAVGDRLIDAGVNLLSRFGSAECGFVMSSHRDYARDREWQYLRPLGGPGLLAFEPRGDGLSELVVKPGWPSMVKTNRGDGSYATSDLFEPHCSRPNSWRYHSRADAQITLVNGKKFDPSPLEAAISASTPLVRDVLIFGAGHDYPGILLFTTRSDLPPRDVTNSVWPEIDRLNAGSQSHARITKSMLVVVPVRDDQAPLDKSTMCWDAS
ncbi:hypothetical protein CDD83_10617 [Cordyceps sp. RAO-2017]|nr:hypothetical protein CDD83_10617 [Cordyceps sp. RAO-2017]